MPNLAYRAALWQGKVLRRRYRASLSDIVRRKIDPPQNLDLDVFAYSNEEMLPEQVASIRSFLQHAGRPIRFIVVSDGSHLPDSIDLLRSIDDCVQFLPHPPVPSGLSEKLKQYLSQHHTGKQLALIMSLPQDRPSLYLDADILFFQGANQISALLAADDGCARYLRDCRFSGDPRLLQADAEKGEPVNTGVLLLRRKLDWTEALARFDRMTGEPEFHTNQTITHLAMHRNGARALDPATYVLQLDDQTVWRDAYASPHLVLRHYVNPVRHKFWTSLKQ